jgi:hypothetical protein
MSDAVPDIRPMRGGPICANLGVLPDIREQEKQMEIPRQQADEQEPALPTTTATAPPLVIKQDVDSGNHVTQPRSDTLLGRSNQDLAEALTTFRRAVHRGGPDFLQ